MVLVEVGETVVEIHQEQVVLVVEDLVMVVEVEVVRGHHPRQVALEIPEALKMKRVTRRNQVINLLMHPQPPRLFLNDLRQTQPHQTPTKRTHPPLPSSSWPRL